MQVGRFKSEITIIDSVSLNSDLFQEVDDIMAFIKKHLQIEYIITGEPQHKERFDYPLDAIREIVVNMIVHRDYRDSSASIIKIFDNKIEFYNPGKLYGGITVQDLLSGNYVSKSRNKLISRAFKEAGIIERYGSGIMRICKICREYGIKEPDFSEISNGLLRLFTQTSFHDLVFSKLTPMSSLIILDCAFILLPFLVLAIGLFSQRGSIALANTGSAALFLLYAVFSFSELENASINASLLTWHVSGFGVLVRELLLLSFFFASILSGSYNLRNKPEFLGAMLFVAVGGMLVVSASELLSLFIGLELATMPMYFLVAWNKFSSQGSEAALKYALMGSIATAVLLFGVGYLYGFAGSLSFADISNAVYNAASTDLILLIAVFFIIVGVGFKLTLFPFHTWAPDVYEGAPTPITAYLSVTSKAVALVFLGVLVYGPLAGMGSAFQLIFSVLAMATIFIGNLGALKQSRLRRFMAYSSIAQAGYILVGLCGSAHLGESSFIYYLFLYAFSNYLMFFLIGIIGKNRSESFDSLKGLSKENPMLAVLFAISAFSLAGIPPLAGFIGKWMVFASAASAGNYALVGFAAINSVIALYYYLQVIKAAWVNEPDENLPPVHVYVWQKIILVFLGAAVLFLGVAPWLHSYIYNLVL